MSKATIPAVGADLQYKLHSDSLNNMILLHDLISKAASGGPSRVALIRKGTQVTYEQLHDLVERTASGLVQLNLKRGDRVAVYLPKQVEAVASMFAASAAGCMFVPVNPVLKPAQVAYILADSGARVLITSASRYDALSQALHSLPRPPFVVIVDDSSGVTETDKPRVVGWGEFIGTRGSSGRRGIDVDPVAILYTSGSTGKPKGVVLSQRNMVCGAESVSEYLHNSSSDRLLSVLPFSFDYGFSQLSTAFMVGASVVLLDYLLPRDVLVALESNRVTGLAAVPPLWIQLARLDWPDTIAERLRYITNSGGAMPQGTLHKLRTKLPSTSIFLMYGLTEAFRSTFLPPDQVDKRPTSIGKAIPNAEVLVVRPDGTECAPNEPGELVHRGALVGLGYWNDPVRTAERYKPVHSGFEEIPIAETAVWSGDTVMRDEEGYLYFVGRRDEMIKTSGYRVSPTEIEEIVMASGLVAEAVAFGVPHPELGQAIVVAAVSCQLDHDAHKELLAYCRANMANYMVPRHLEWFAELPRNANGKLDRSGIAGCVSVSFEHEEIPS